MYNGPHQIINRSSKWVLTQNDMVYRSLFVLSYSHLLSQYVSLCEGLSAAGRNPTDPSALKAAVTPLAQSLDAK